MRSYPQWQVFERKLSDGSSVFDVWFMQSDGTIESNPIVYARDEISAYALADELNAAIERAC